jgi:hypothetical protein
MEPTDDYVIVVDAQPDVIMINMTTALTQCMILSGHGCRRRPICNDYVSTAGVSVFT